jgi:hypothetical protein
MGGIGHVIYINHAKVAMNGSYRRHHSYVIYQLQLKTGMVLSKLIRWPPPLDADVTPFFCALWHHCQMLIGLAAGIIIEPLDLACGAFHGDVIEAADSQTPA